MNLQLGVADLSRISEASSSIDADNFAASADGCLSIGKEEMMEFAAFAECMKVKKQRVERLRREAIHLERFDRQFCLG